MKIIFVFLWPLAFSAPAHAHAQETAGTYEFRQKKIEVIEREGLIVSQGCRAPQCAALKDLGRLSWAAIQAKYPGTQATGSLLCEKILRGKVVLGTSEIGDENAFCRFENDGSLIELGSLVYRARQNDEAAASLPGAKDLSPTNAAPPTPAAPSEDQP